MALDDDVVHRPLKRRTGLTIVMEDNGTKAIYAAFLSYNHRDVAWARRLQRRLESYRFPGRTVRSDGKRKLGPIFRDRDELPAAADLSEAVKQALSKSAALLVLCSPNSAASPWVDKEIRLFRALHPDRPILAAIIDSEPTDAFPPALRDGVEPLAADLRREGDGVRLGTLKIIAGLAGIGLDRLVQRDAQRRIRRVMAVTLALLLIMLAFVALSVAALQAQREAERQRAEAEGIIEFMLTDLRERLRSVGRLDALTVVNDRAMNYYRDQGNLDDLPYDSLERRARILQAMGEDDIARGSLPAARRKFEEAHRTTTALLNDDPERPEWIFVHAQSEFWIGQVDQLSGQPDRALQHYWAYLHWSRQLLQHQPHAARSFTEMGYALSNIASVQSEAKNDHADAIRNYEKSLYWFQRAQQADSRSLTIRKEVAERHARLADVHYDRRDFHAAAQHRLEQVRLLEPLRREDPHNGDIAYDTLVATRSLARIAFETGETAKAVRLLQDAQIQSSALRRRDPQNQNWFEQHLRLLMDAAEVARARHRGAEVHHLVGQARGIMRDASPNAAADPAFRITSIKGLDAIEQADNRTLAKGD